MESKEGKKFNFKIGSIVAIAVVATIVGTLAFTSFETNSDSNTNTQSIGIGAFVTVEVFDEDGNLNHTWEGHNKLGDLTRGIMVLCFSGQLEDDILCSFLNTDSVILFLGNPGQQNTDKILADSTDITLAPETCWVFGQDSFLDAFNCTGWTVVGTYDVPAGPACTEGVDCQELREIATTTLEDDPDVFFNTILLQPIIIVEPGDRVIVTMNFEIPL